MALIGLHDVPVGRIDPDPSQARKHFDPSKADELSGSMLANGLAVPILLRPSGDRYAIVHGERRWRAACSLGWGTIRAEIRDVSRDEAGWLSLVENVQRASLTPIEEAEAYLSVLGGGMTQESLGKRIGKSQGYIAQKLRLLKLPSPVTFYLARGAIGEGHARQLLRLRGILTPDLVADFGVLRKDADRLAGLLSQPEYVFALFLAIQPEDRPAWYPTRVVTEPERPASGLVSEASARFIEHVRGRDYEVPRWEVVAFWWASLAVDLALPVSSLHEGIDGWRERFLSAILFTRGLRVIDPASDEEREAQFRRQGWGYLSDLRHAGCSSWLDGGMPGSVIERAYEMALSTGSVAGPSDRRSCHVT